MSGSTGPDFEFASLTDEQLMDRVAQNSDKAASEALCGRWFRRLKRIQKSRVGNDESAKDLTQQTLTRVLRSRRSWITWEPPPPQRDKTFKEWILTIAKNVFLTEAEKKERKPLDIAQRLPVKDDEEQKEDLLESVIDGGWSPEQEAYFNEIKAKLRDCIGKLSKQEHTVVWMKHGMGCSDEEIGAKLWPDADSPPTRDSVTRRINRVRTEAFIKLRGCLQSKGFTVEIGLDLNVN